MRNEECANAINALWITWDYIQDQQRLTSGNYPTALYNKENLTRMEELVNELGRLLAEPIN